MTPFTASERADLQRAGENYERGKAAVAEKFARKVLKAHPRSPELLQFVAAIVKAQGRAEEAVDLCQKAAVLAPQDAQVHYNLGTALIDANRFEVAIASLRLAVDRQPNNADYQTNLALALLKDKQFNEAEQVVRRALQLRPLSFDALVILGFAVYGQRKLEEAVAAFRLVLANHPQSATAYYGLACCNWTARRHAEALKAIDSALAIKREQQALTLKAGILGEFGSWDEMLPYLKEANSNPVKDADALVKQLQCQRRLALWEDQDAELTQLIAVLAGSTTAQPWDLLAFIDDPNLQMDYASRFGNSFRHAVEPLPPALPRSGRSKIRLAYVSSDLRDHIVGHLAKAVVAAHDRNRFDVIGVSLFKPGQIEIAKDVKESFDEFYEVGDQSNTEIAKLIRQLDTDIAVDLNGYTSGNFQAVFAARPAPIQVNYLGYAGTSGVPWMDYIVADRMIIPECDEKYYSERVVRLPCLLPTNYVAPAPVGSPRRMEYGLPDDGFVFCCFNNVVKIGPQQWDIWMQLLAEVARSVLWLRVESPGVQYNLRAAASKRGIEPTRIIFAPRLPFSEHLQRLRAADLFLDTWPYNAHTTATDALWAGVPVLTLPGRSFASRVSAGVLAHLDLPELIATSAEDYLRRAMTLATNHKQWAALRRTVDAARTTSTLFDVKAYTLGLEGAFDAMLARS